MGYLKDESEIWIDMQDDKLHNTGDKYSVSSYGRVWNKLDECFVSPVLTGKPQYWYVNLRLGVERKLRRVHYLQAYSFYGPPPKDDAGSVKKQTCDHEDRNRFNNSLWNLRWLGRKEQSSNQDRNVLWGGKSLISLVRDDYKNLDEVYLSACSAFIRTQVGVKGYTYNQSKELYRQRELLQCYQANVVIFKNTPVYVAYLAYIFNIPYKRVQNLTYLGYELYDMFPTFNIKDVDFSDSYEVGGMEVGKWYPSKIKLCEGEGISELSLRNRLRKGLTAEEAIHHDPYDLHRFTLDGHFMSVPEHCKRLCVSESKVRVYTGRYGMSVNDALEKAKTPTRIIKHEISGESEKYGEFSKDVRRNKAWWEFFGIEPKYGNGRMCKGNTMQEVLKYTGIDTTGLTITPYTM